MKKIIFVLCFFVSLSIMPAYAAFCIKCGKNLPKAANFCPNCGTASNKAFQATEPESSSYIEQKQSNSNYLKSKNSYLAGYDFINKIERLMTESTSSVALRQSQEIKRQNAYKLQQIESEYSGYNLYMRKLHDLNIYKLAALENYLEARKASDSSEEKARNKAIMAKEAFIIGKINEAIAMLLDGGNSLSNLNKVEELEKRVKKTTANYIVTSSYLNLGNVRVRRNEPIWIEDVSGASAKVHHMGSSESDEPAVGYLSVYDLERRSNWTSDAAFYYSSPKGTTVIITQPVRPEPNVNVVVWDGIYPYQRFPPPIIWDPHWPYWPYRYPRRHPAPPPHHPRCPPPPSRPDRCKLHR